MRRARDLRDAADRESAQTVASKLVATPITIAVKAGAEGRLFGSVTAADVAAAIESQTHVSIDRRKLHVDHIKAVGTHTVTAKLHHDVEFPITVEVVAK
jgi:large subunit ribosomal protein L9